MTLGRDKPIRAPVFFVGMPRSGTTVMFQVFAAHPELGWFSQYLDRVPGLPAISVVSRVANARPAFRKSVARSDQQLPRWLDKARVSPTEAYAVWSRCCGDKFIYDYLLGQTATEDERRRLRATVEKVLRYQGRPRFATKITGPGRIGYLSSVFPDALFVHVIRDGRAVVQSLMNVEFWKGTFRLREPAWRNGLTDEQLARWRDTGGSPLALAAIQWGTVIRTTRREAAELAPCRYAEVRYEDFVREPDQRIEEISDFCALRRSRAPHAFLEARFTLRDMNYQWHEQFKADDVKMLEDLVGDLLGDLGYGGDSPRSGHLVRPFS